MTRRAALLALSLLACAMASSAQAPKEVRSALLHNVHHIAVPGVPGPLVLTSSQVFAVVCAKSGERIVEPVVCAGTWGKGRVVAFGHPGYFGEAALESADTGVLLANALRWLSGDRKAPRIGVYRRSELVRFLNAKGFPAHLLAGSEWTRELAKVDVLFCVPADLSEAQIKAVQSYVRRGGGLCVADLGWGWLQLNPGKDITQHHGNQLLAEAGILWADGYLSPTSPQGYRADLLPPSECHALNALKYLQQTQGKPATRDAPRLEQAVWSLEQAVRTLPRQSIFTERVRRLCSSVPADLLALRKPITQSDPLTRLAFSLLIQDMKRLPPEEFRAHPSAEIFPGAVPPDAPRVRRAVSVDPRIVRWHSTGLYAAPGEVITVRVPAEAVGKGLSVRIGAHTDTLWHLSEWKRAPEVSFSFPLNATEVKVASPFGGAVYIEVPQGCVVGRFTAVVDGAVRAPYFVLGQTDLEAWRDTIRHLPAPWAELQGRRVVLTVPSRVVRNLDDPESLLRFWDGVVDACAELAGVPYERPYPERYVCDVQISAGYMHSGYPIMTHLDVAELVVDLSRLKREGSWGHFHEMGHNHQSADWTFEGTGEVTVNLFSMYIYHKVLGQPFDEGHPAIRDREKRLQRVKDYIARGARFEEWKNDPFLALTMYIQVIEQFGWEPIKAVIAEYRTLPESQKPRNDDEKRDQWMIRLSHAVRRNLAPFFARWGVPISSQATEAVKHLPEWMPAEFASRP